MSRSLFKRGPTSELSQNDMCRILNIRREDLDQLDQYLKDSLEDVFISRKDELPEWQYLHCTCCAILHAIRRKMFEVLSKRISKSEFIICKDDLNDMFEDLLGFDSKPFDYNFTPQSSRYLSSTLDEYVKHFESISACISFFSYSSNGKIFTEDFYVNVKVVA